MTTAEMLQAVRTALAEDQAFIAWCRTEFADAPTIQIDYDDGVELEEDLFPMVAVARVRHHGSIQQRVNVFTLEMFAAVATREVSEEFTTAGGARVKTITYPGRLQAESLREQAIAVLYRSQLGKITIGSESMSRTYQPKYYSPFTVTIEERI